MQGLMPEDDQYSGCLDSLSKVQIRNEDIVMKNSSITIHKEINSIVNNFDAFYLP